MTQHADILDQHESMRGPFTAALILHGSLLAAIVVSSWLAAHTESFGDPKAGGAAVGIEVAASIPIPHHGRPNPVANDSQSEVPQQPAKDDRVKQEAPPPDAVGLKNRLTKKKPAEVASQKHRFQSFDKAEPNQVFSKQAQQVSNPAFSTSGSGQIGTGMNTTLGDRFGGYARQIRELVAQKWRTTDVDAKVAPVVIATFDLMRDGSIRNLQLLQTSGNSSLDFSVRRAILDASPFPPIPPTFDKDHARVEFSFELKR